MSKKLITACLGLLALAAFILPATASAAPEITHPTGTRLNPTTGSCTSVAGTVCVTATNVGETLLKTDPASGEPTVLARCTTAAMTGYLKKNNGTEIEATIHTATFSGTGGLSNGMNECTGSFGNITVTTNGNKVDNESVTNGTPWCIRATKAMEPDEFQLTGGDCVSEPPAITFILDSTTAGECKYTRSAAVKGTYTTDSTGDAVLTVTAKEGTLADTTFTREAGGVLCPGTGTLEMSFTLETDEKEAKPLYIS